MKTKIMKGEERQRFLKELARSLVRLNVKPGIRLETLKGANKLQCDPTLSEEEVKDILRCAELGIRS